MASWILIGVAGLFGAVLVWGVISPGTQWRVLVGWSTHDPDRAEPGDGVQGLTRLICAVGLLGLLAVAGVQLWDRFAPTRQPAIELAPVEQMWGSPAPGLIDRVIVPTATVPTDLVGGLIDGYEAIDSGSAPAYLVGMPHWTLLGDPAPTGIVGVDPATGRAGYGDADVLVAAEGPLNCIPRAVVVTGDDATLAIGVYWGLPGAAGQDHLSACRITDGALLQTVLVPVALGDSVGDRTVTTIDGTPVAPVTDTVD